MPEEVKEIAVEVLGGPSLQASSKTSSGTSSFARNGLRQRKERKPYIWIIPSLKWRG